MASAITKNPFAALNEDDDEPTAAPSGAVPQKDNRHATGPAKKDHATKDEAKSKAATGGAGGRAPRREHDRRDASGRGNRTDKKGGNGKGNWGREDDVRTPQKELTEEEQAALDAAAEKAEEERKKEAAQKTLAEYLKSKEGADELAAKEGRKADAIDMKGLKVKEDEELDDLMGLASGKVSKGKKASTGRKGQAVQDLGFTTAAPAPAYEERGSGGGRGGGRGGSRGGGRGGGRGGERSGPAPNLGDSSAFPTLG